jgi:trehalose 6-phosphate synthase/phosphatase
MLLSTRPNIKKNPAKVDESTNATADRIIIVSNRLPVKATVKSSGVQFHKSEGGLATGLSSVYKQNNNVWIGWPGAYIDEKSQRDKINKELKSQNLLPVYLSETEINEYYEGFSNETLWPLYHYFPSYTYYRYKDWETYVQVNEKFAEAIVSIAQNNDIIWIHDYQLTLVPEIVRSKLPNVTIGFFQHIPFPSYDIFRLLPWRKEILKGMLGADLIGLHTLDDTKHFMNACIRILDAEIMSNRLAIEGRQVLVDAFPMGIDYEKFHQWSQKERTIQNEKKLRQAVGPQKLMISVDRLDYSKGILNRLEAFEYLLQQYPEFKEKISFLQLIVPSRDQVPQYKFLKDEIDKKVSSINAKYRTFGWTPIFYYYRSFPMDMLSALYRAADIAVVTPMRDGMNLVSKEYVASKADKKGVLILSEMAGASKELLHALIVNPNDLMDMVDAMRKAIAMPEEEQKARLEIMQEVISKYNVYHWVNLFIETLQDVKQHQQKLATKMVTTSVTNSIVQRYLQAKKRLFLLDYDGTLVPYFTDINQAAPDTELKELLYALTQDPLNRVVIISGRNYQTLEKWLQGLQLDVVAEHGAWSKKHGMEWEKFADLSSDWKPSIRHIMEMYTNRTPGSFIEEKSFSLVWHYRNVSTELGEERARELCDNLKFFSTHHALQILPGNKIVEVKNSEINKGKAAKGILKENKYDFIITIGDDATDEYTFKAMPARAFTIRVGSTISAANYFVRSYKEVHTLLKELVTAGSAVPIKK